MIHLYKYVGNENNITKYIQHDIVRLVSIEENALTFEFTIHFFKNGYLNSKQFLKTYIISDSLEYISIGFMNNKTLGYASSTMVEDTQKEFKLLNDEFSNEIFGRSLDKHIIIYKTTSNDIIIYALNNCNLICDFSSVEETSESIDDLVYKNYSEDEYLIIAKELYKKNYAYENFFSKLRGYATPIGSYLDLECDMVMNFIKFLYDKKDSTVLEFLNSNEKYKTILEESISDNKNVVENKHHDSIVRSFERKKIIQDAIAEYKQNISLIEESKSVNEFPIIEAIFNKP